MIKKAQGEVITIVLIILLVLASVVIVWQVVNSAVSKGAKQVERGSSCLGVSLEIIPAANLNNINAEFTVRRSTGGDSFSNSVSVVPLVMINGNLAQTGYSWNPQNPDFRSPLSSAKLTISNLNNVSTLEVALKVDESVCPLVAKWTKY